MEQWDENCPACRAAKGKLLITKDAHTCGICWGCRATKDDDSRVVSLLGHICGQSNEVNSGSKTP